MDLAPIRRLAALLAAALLLGAALPGCTEELPDAALIERPRPLGARLEPEADPARAWPRPGERATVRFPLAFPGAPRPFEALLAACPLAPGRYGQPQCAEGAEPVPLAPCPEAPPWEACGALAVPEAAGAERLLVAGLLCVEGSLRLDPGAEPPLRCEGASLQEGLLLRLPLWDGEGEPNHHPSLGPVALDGAELPEPPAAWRLAEPSGCPPELAGEALTARPDGEAAEGEPPHRFELRLPEEAAEPLPGGGREELVTAHLVTAGKLERRFGAPEPAEGGGWRVRVGYWPPPRAEVPEEGLLVRLHLTVRDGRGGFAETMRAFCVRP